MNAPNIRPRRRIDVTPTEQEVVQEMSVHEGFIHVRRAAYGVESESREVIPVPLFGTRPGVIRVSAGSTRNLGDYNSARVEVTVEVPCYPVASEYQRAYDFAAGLLDEIIPQELAKAGVPTQEG